MLKVLIVDDNEHIVEVLPILIDWESLGFCVAATARSGKEALVHAQNQMFDVVITDIRMPKMSGLELVEEMRKINPETEFIVLTSYGEFEYAKKAIECRVKGYLLKPIEETELIEILRNIKEETEAKRCRKSKHRKMLMNMLINGENVEFDDLLFYKDITVRYIMVCENTKEKFSKKIDKRSINSDKLIETIRQYSDLRQEFIVENVNGEIEMIFEEDVEIRTKANRFAEYIKENIDFDFYIFVGKSVDKIEKIKDSKDSITFLFDKLFYSWDRVVYIADEEQDLYNDGISDRKWIDDVVQAIKEGNSEATEKAVTNLVNILRQEQVKPSTVILYVHNILFDLMDTVSSDWMDALKYTNRLSMMQKDRLLKLDDVVFMLNEISSEFCETVKKVRNLRGWGIVGKVVEYIDENYSNTELKLQMLANLYFVNVTYLGQLFKKKVGKNFKAYLNEVRIEKAKEILKNSEYKIYEVAERVGFSDPNYFTIKFTEQVGMLPKKYRETVGIQEQNEE